MEMKSLVSVSHDEEAVLLGTKCSKKGGVLVYRAGPGGEFMGGLLRINPDGSFTRLKLRDENKELFKTNDEGELLMVKDAPVDLSV